MRPKQNVPDDVFYDALFLKNASAQGGDDGDDDDDDEEADEHDDKGENKASEQAAASGAAGPSSSGASAVPQSLRAYILLLLNLHAVKASSSLESAQQELELLASMPSEPLGPRPPAGANGAQDSRERARGPEGAEWRLDRSFGASGSMGGALLDPKGRPLRPFTITGSRAEAEGQAPTELGQRQRIREEVFRPSHRLPTMNIDEYLDEEYRRGNIIEGGGAKSMEDPTPREARALRAENDGSREAEEAEEEARKEAIEWDAFKEANPKGAGNTMNRG